MAFNSQLVASRLALGMIGPDEMPALAWDALEAGLDGPHIRRLASLIKPSGWEIDQIIPAFMAETGMKSISQEKASVRVARELANRILKEGLDPLAYARYFECLWIQADHPSAIQDLGTLEDDKYVAECMGQSEVEIRDYAHGLLAALVEADIE